MYLLSPKLLYNNTRKQRQQLSRIPLNEHHASDITTKDRRQFLVTLLSSLYWFI